MTSLPQDSIVHRVETVQEDAPADAVASVPAAVAADTVARRSRPDSVIQAILRPQPIRYSDQPDTLHLPGYGPGVKLTDVQLSKYYDKTFFADRELLETATTNARYGVPGDPVPYTLHGDNIITLLLLACFMLSVVSFANSRRFFTQQFKGLFHVPRSDDNFMPETSNELRFQLFLVAQTCLLLAILQYAYTREFIGTTFTLASDYHLIGLFALLFVAYFVVRAALYTAVNTVFFDTKRNAHWLKTLLFITSVEGVALFPVVLLLAYFDLSIESVIFYLTIVLILVKTLTFYKCFIIFFRRISGYLQIFLYFCTLEIVPLTLFWGILILTGKLLKVNY